MTNLSDTLLVSISFSDKDTGVLVVGKKERINLDGGGSTACISPFMAYDQYRPVRGKIAIWTKDEIVNKLMR